VDSWDLKANCRGLGPELFFPESGTAAEARGVSAELAVTSAVEAKRICADCSVIIPCLDWAVRHDEQGIWGGVGPDRRSLLRAALNSGNALAYHVALMEVLAELGRQVRGHEDEREVTPEGSCGRCGARRRAGRLPVDGNGPGARCGLAATYNRGCRCDPCVEAKSEWQKRQKAKRRKAKAKDPFGEAFRRERGKRI